MMRVAPATLFLVGVTLALANAAAVFDLPEVADRSRSPSRYHTYKYGGPKDIFARPIRWLMVNNKPIIISKQLTEWME